jgi:hypothetical protein
MLAINFRLAPTVSSSSLPATNSDTLTGHQLNETIRPFDLWKQVQKSSKFVDFTRVGAERSFSRIRIELCTAFTQAHEHKETDTDRDVAS